MRFSFNFPAVDVLLCGKYEKRKNGSYIRKEVGGRFHVYLFGKNTIDMHYDLYVDGGRRHFTAPLYNRLKEEVKSLRDNYVKKEAEKKNKKVWKEKVKQSNIEKTIHPQTRATTKSVESCG